MEPVFTLPYPEYAIIDEIKKYFKEGYSVLIPSSRQQKGYDLAIYNQKSKKCITIQVKSSRTYPGSAPKRKTKRERFKYSTWFNGFEPRRGYADYYILFGLYTKELKNKKLDKSRKIRKWYSNILLLFDEKEMIDFLKKLRTRKRKRESKFGFGFNFPEKVYLTRGDVEDRDMSKFLFGQRINKIIRKLR